LPGWDPSAGHRVRHSDAQARRSRAPGRELVKGAYLETQGALSYGEATDVAFLKLAARLAEHGGPWSAATHDGRLGEALLLAHGPVTIEQLFGVRPDVLHGLASRGIPTRVYVPYGTDWFRYWLRRVAESRGA
jgi:proline dehydrogenase